MRSRQVIAALITAAGVSAALAAQTIQINGAGASVKWPTGIGGKGNEGVSGLVSQTPGAIWLCGAHLRGPEQDRLRVGAEQRHGAESAAENQGAVTAPDSLPNPSYREEQK
jgi:ABC-type phosphate transport system substrate-binding protein